MVKIYARKCSACIIYQQRDNLGAQGCQNQRQRVIARGHAHCAAPQWAKFHRLRQNPRRSG
jgi:hypothetical protein